MENMNLHKIITPLSLDETKIIKAAQARFNQTKFPSKDPCLSYKLGYLQGFKDCLKLKT